MTVPTRETDRIQRIYDERAETYDRSLGIIEHRVLGPMRRAYGSLLRGETLEVAIGTGLNLPFYAPVVTHVVGSELSYPMLVQAKARARQLGMRFAGVQADATKLPFGDASFDTVAISLASVHDPGAGGGAAGDGSGLPAGRSRRPARARPIHRHTAGARAAGADTDAGAQPGLPSRPGHHFAGSVSGIQVPGCAIAGLGCGEVGRGPAATVESCYPRRDSLAAGGRSR